MKKIRFVVIVSVLSLAGLLSCSKKEEVKPTATVLFFIKDSPNINIGNGADLEFNGTIVGRITRTLNTQPNCNASTSNSVIKIANVEIGVEHTYRFILSNGISSRIFTFTIPTAPSKDGCWLQWIE